MPIRKNRQAARLSFFLRSCRGTDSFGRPRLVAIILGMVAKQSGLFGAAFETRVVEDIDALASAMVDGLQGEYVQLESPTFRGRWTSIRWPSLVAQFGT